MATDRPRNSQSGRCAAIDGPSGLFLWANAGEQLQAHADKLLRQLTGGH